MSEVCFLQDNDKQSSPLVFANVDELPPPKGALSRDRLARVLDLNEVSAFFWKTYWIFATTKNRDGAVSILPCEGGNIWKGAPLPLQITLGPCSLGLVLVSCL